MLTKLKTLTSRGDTIIEVMMVLAVLGLAISISYATANRSLLDARQAQENTQATELVQTQIENLSVLADNSTSGNKDATTNIFLPTAAYCIRDPLAASPIGSSCDFGTGNYPMTVLIYNCNNLTSDAHCTSISSQDTFVVEASWPNVFGEDNDTVTLSYRAHSKD